MNCIFDINNIVKTFDENKNSHAFLINTNNFTKALEDVLKIIKKINCKTQNDNCSCKSCSLIDSSTNPDIVFIKPDGKEIKKDSIDSLIKLFSTTPLISKYKTYIVLYADKMNQSSANKILKFLEEPEKKIIGFFLTDKIYEIIDTIKSRCQIFDAQYDIFNFFDYFNLTEEDFNTYFDDTMKILEMLNIKENYILINNLKKYAKKERVDLLKIFDIICNMYVLKYESLLGNKKDFNNSQLIIDTIMENDYNIILNRIKLLNELISRLKLNVNKELVINKTFLEWV